MAFLAVERLTKRFAGLVAVEEVGFEVEAGEILGLIGPNGAGKSTILSLIAGELRPTEGRIAFDGSDIQGLRPAQVARRGIARTFQRTSVFSDISVRENVLIGTHLTTAQSIAQVLLGSRSTRYAEKRLHTEVDAIIDFVGLSGRAAAIARNLAYGDQRRLSVGIALAAKPRLVLMDEPAAGMTAEDVNRLAELIRRIRETGTTVILVEHNMRMVMNLCTRLIVLDHGRMIAQGDPADVRRDPQVISVYLGEAPAHAAG